MLVLIAAIIFVLTIIVNAMVIIKFSDEQDKNQAWLPKIVVVRAWTRLGPEIPGPLISLYAFVDTPRL